MVALLLAAVLFAAPAPAKKCPPNCKHRAQATCVQPVPAPAPAPASALAARTALWDEVLSGFEVVAGFRWETLKGCEPEPLIEVKDPFYVGGRITLPLAERVGVFGEWDRDFEAAPKWQARVGVAVAPFK